MKTEIVVASIMSAMLVGCGGGGGAGEAIASPAAAPSIFADPLAAKCEGSGVDLICEVPTSSKMSMDEVWSVLTDAKGGSFKFKAFGRETRSHTVAQGPTAAGERWVAQEGWATYGGSEQEIVLSASTYRLKGKSYPFSATLVNGSRAYRPASSPEGAHVYPYRLEGPETRLIGIDHMDGSGTKEAGSRLQIEDSSWNSFFGLLTDQADVSMPLGETVKYAGSVAVASGDGHPLGHDQLANLLGQFNSGMAVCPLELTLNTRDGKISAIDVTCTDEQKSEMRLVLPPLLVEKSRIRSLLPGDSATGHLSKFFSGSLLGGAEPFKTDQIMGGVYGRNASDLVIHGSGPQGAFFVVVSRR